MERGVPQGSILGPLLFNIFINDLFYFIGDKCNVYNYADDNSMSTHDKELPKVKETLESVSEDAIVWFRGNHMKANAGKFQAMLLTRSDATDFKITVNDIEINAEPCVKLLGMHIDNKLTFDTHHTSNLQNVCVSQNVCVCGRSDWLRAVLTSDLTKDNGL